MSDEPLFALDDRLDARSCAAGRHSLPHAIERIFAVPRPLTVGTLELGNALVYAGLDADPARLETAVSSYATVVSTGTEIFAPTPLGGRIAYAGQRRLHLVDPRAARVDRHFLTGNLQEVVGGFAPVGDSGDRYLARIIRPGRRRDPARLLVLDVSGDDPSVIGERSVPTSQRFHVCGETIVLYDDHELRACDASLQPTSHPLVATVGATAIGSVLSASGDAIQELVVHPRAPMAMVVTAAPRSRGASTLWWVCWHEIDRPWALPVLRGRGLRGLALSPDLEWLRLSGYRDGASPGVEPSDAFVIRLRVEHLPAFAERRTGAVLPLDPPWRLTAEDGPAPPWLAWMEPTAVVGCGGDVLWRWDLGPLDQARSHDERS